MFIRIGETRLKLASIGEYRYDGKSTHTKKWYITVKISGRERSFPFDSEREAVGVIEYLDKTLKVQQA